MDAYKLNHKKCGFIYGAFYFKFIFKLIYIILWNNVNVSLLKVFSIKI